MIVALSFFLMFIQESNLGLESVMRTIIFATRSNVDSQKHHNFVTKYLPAIIHIILPSTASKF
jgi:hypothetical protein